MNKRKHMVPYRCAVYFAPAPDSPWGQAGSRWLGRCADTDQHLDLPTIEGVDALLHASCIAEPRRYGWHATLKAPFVLIPGQDTGSVLSWLHLLAREHAPFDLPAMNVSALGQFLALRPQGANAKLQDMAAACVTRLQHLALPLGEAELARRRQAALTPEQDRLLQKWGYPWVLDQFRFHFSLTGSLDALSQTQRSALFDAAVRHFGGLAPCQFDRLSLFVEPERGADFRLFEQVELCG